MTEDTKKKIIYKVDGNDPREDRIAFLYLLMTSDGTSLEEIIVSNLVFILRGMSDDFEDLEGAKEALTDMIQGFGMLKSGEFMREVK